MDRMVLVASRKASEAAAIATALETRFAVMQVADRQSLNDRVDKAAALVLDTNFSDAQGVDILMEILSRVHVPVLMITPPDDAACAVEALRCGANSYLVKSRNYIALLPTAVREVIQRANANDTLKLEVIALRKRNAILEQQVSAASTSLAAPKRSGGQEQKPQASVSLDEVIAVRIRNGSMQLPAYPRIAMKLRQLLKSDVGIGEVAQLLSQDAAVSVKLLRAANAAQYGNLRKVDTVESAVSRLGLNGACNIAEIVANRSLYTTRNAAYRTMLEDLWLHSVACAHAAEAIGRHLGKSSWQKLFSLGLLHDVGKLALLQAIAQSDPEGKRIDGEENRKTFRQFLETQHVPCGVSLMQQWNFHQDYHLIARYHEDIRGADKSFRTLLIVHMANQFVRTLGYGDPLDSPQAFEASPAKTSLFPGEVDLSFIAEAVQHAVEETRSLVG